MQQNMYHKKKKIPSARWQFYKQPVFRSYYDDTVFLEGHWQKIDKGVSCGDKCAKRNNFVNSQCCSCQKRKVDSVTAVSSHGFNETAEVHVETGEHGLGFIRCVAGQKRHVTSRVFN